MEAISPKFNIVGRDMTFEKVTNIKYLGVDVNEWVNKHNKINQQITAGNKSVISH